MKNFLLCLLLTALSFGQLLAQERTISGTVTGSDGKPVPFATVQVEGTNQGTVTDEQGNFTVPASGDAVIRVSYVGYNAIEVPVNNQSSLSITLQVNPNALNELVVTALGIKREKRTLSYTTQEVKGEDLVKSRETNFLNALQGKVAGVQINSNSGMPGSGSRIVIRGASSLTGQNQPLFVVDGVPISNQQIGAGDDDPVLFGGSTPNRGVDIDPNIIASVNILRGAAATALYGSRAAGGAVIITTKSGQGMKKGMTVNVSTAVTFDQAILPEFQDKYSAGIDGKYYDEVNQQTSSSWGARLDTLKVNGAPVKKYDPRSQFFKTGVTSDNSVSLTGTTDKSDYLLSYSFLKQGGIVPNTNYTRNSVYGRFGTQFSDKLRANVTVNYVNSDNDRQPEGNGTSSYLWGIMRAPVTYNLKPVLDENGDQRTYLNTINNPFWAVDNIGLNLNVDRFITNGSLIYQPLDWLTFTERIGADVYSDTRKFHEEIGSKSDYPDGRMFDELIHSRQINHDFYVEARRDLSSDLDLSVMVGNNIISEWTNDVFNKGIGLSGYNFFDISNAETVTSSVDLQRRRRVSVYGQAILEYKKMLSLTVTGRNDWSSTLPINNRSYFYPSVSGAFVFSELPGLNGSSALSFGKLRAAYTVIGNDADPYKTGTYYSKPAIGDGQRGEITLPFDGQNAFVLDNVQGNPNLKPERIKEFEVGLETQWLHNRLGLEVDYYNKISQDLIFQTPVAASSGFVESLINAGEIRNNGLEVTLNATPVQSKDFNWNISVNWSKNNSKIVSLAEGVPYIQVGGFVDPGIFLVKGYSYGSIWGTKWKRNEKGQLLIDEDGYPIVDDALGVIGDISPDWIGGITNEFSYKGIGLSFTWDTKQGGDVMNLDRYYLGAAGVAKYTDTRETTKVFEGVHEDGKPNTTPVKLDQSYYRSYVPGVEEAWVEDGTFVKLRNVTLSYSLDPKILKRSLLKGATLSVTGRNLYIYKPHFTGSDPELGLYGSGSNSQGFYNFITPSTRSYTVALKLTF
ncbi:SusC/RagA family TonB-linked outer membrane protein [Compostibacter hankyongensis]|uniref:SusC/RagA family TonB-linked outer membrane protein n=1 Tax=Compostibacter hankyongensis TaxID=1007089 RepID=A0ABP8FSN5_9BACT